MDCNKKIAASKAIISKMPLEQKVGVRDLVGDAGSSMSNRTIQNTLVTGAKVMSGLETLLKKCTFLSAEERQRILRMPDGLERDNKINEVQAKLNLQLDNGIQVGHRLLDRAGENVRERLAESMNTLRSGQIVTSYNKPGGNTADGWGF